jgi:hypothetical protein
MNKKITGLLLALSLSLIACLPLLAGDGPINTRGGGDSPFLLVRLHQLVANLRAGVFPARWMPDAAYGLGYPFFNFYASLPYYIAALFKLLGFGFIWSIKLTQALGFIAAAASMYLLARRLFDRETNAILAALAYTYAPYHLVNVYVRGDALSEFYAFVFYSLIFWALLRLRDSLSNNQFLPRITRISLIHPSAGNIALRQAQDIALVALAYGGLILTHNVSALIFSAFVGLWAIAHGFSSTGNKRPAISYLLHAISSLGLGLAISAWYWLPALLEGKYGQLEHQTTGYLNYSNHFRGLDLVQPSLLFDYAIEPGQTPFAVGLAQAVFALVGAAAIVVWWVKRRRPEAQSAFFIASLALATFFITPLSRPLWDNVPLLPFVQFPWRFLSVQAFFASLVIGYLGTCRGVGVPNLLEARRNKPEQDFGEPFGYAQDRLSRAVRDSGSDLPRPHLLAGIVGAVLLLTSMLGLKPEYLPIGEADVTVERLMLYEYFTANVGTTIRHEYLPRWVVPRPYTSEALLRSGEKPPPLVMAGEVKVAELVWRKPAAEGWTLDVTSPQASLAFHTYYFPGWRAYVDGQPREVQPVENLGYIGLDLDQGEHQVVLRLEHTPLRALAERLSLVAALVVIGLLIAGKLTRRRGNKATRQRGNEATRERGNEAARQRVNEVTSQRYSPLINSLLVNSLPFIMAILLLSVNGLRTSGPNDHPTTRPPDQGPSDQTMDFDRLPYLHHNPQGVNFGGVARLKNYELSADEVEAGETVEVVLHWDEVKGEGLEAGVRLTSPAEHLFHTSACIAEDSVKITQFSQKRRLSKLVAQRRAVSKPSGSYGQARSLGFDTPAATQPALAWLPGRELNSLEDSIPLWDGTTHHHLKVPEEAVRGLYLISVKLKDETGEIKPITERGETLGTTYLRPLRVRSQRWATGDEPTLASFGPGIVLSQVETEQTKPEALEARLTWRVVEPVAANYGLALRLRDADGQALASLDTQPHYGLYPTSMWRGGELVSDGYVLPLPEGTPPGDDYSLEVILYEVASLAPIGTAQESVVLTEPTIKATYPVLQEFDQLTLAELSPVTAQIEQVQPLFVKAKWAATEHPTRDYACRLSLRDESGTTVQSQTEPIARSYATSLWPTNAIVASRYQMALDPLLPAGRYDLVITVDDAQTGEGFGEFVLPLGVEIVGRERSYAIPPMQAKLDISFGGQMRLLGYDLGREGGELRLGLHWQALHQMQGDYKVFVHLFNPATEEIVAQDDAMPRQNQYPTSWWAEGEVVSDEITLSMKDVPPGHYRLALGVYDPQTMDRLAAVGPDNTPIANDRVVLDEMVAMP